jgi:hypothetical protein
VTFARLRPADWVVLVALGLLLATAADALRVLYRILQEPGFDALTTVQLGAPLALVLLGAIACAAAVSVRQEEGAAAADLQSR